MYIIVADSNLESIVVSISLLGILPMHSRYHKSCPELNDSARPAGPACDGNQVRTKKLSMGPGAREDVDMYRVEGGRSSVYDLHVSIPVYRGRRSRQDVPQLAYVPQNPSVLRPDKKKTAMTRRSAIKRCRPCRSLIPCVCSDPTNPSITKKIRS